MYTTAVYIGAGLDFTPVLTFDWIDRFIYIDSQPLTEFGSLQPCKEYSRPEFEFELPEAMKHLGRVIKLPNSNLIILNLPDARQVFYYTNNCFPQALDADCRALITTASVLICCGFVPNPLILTTMKSGPKTFITDNNTCWEEGDYYTELVKRIQQEPSIFENYIMFERHHEEKSLDPDCSMKAKTVTQHSSIQELIIRRDCKGGAYGR